MISAALIVHNVMPTTQPVTIPATLEEELPSDGSSNIEYRILVVNLGIHMSCISMPLNSMMT